eukprot:190337_1
MEVIVSSIWLCIVRVHGDCQLIDNGGWKLVRHTQGEWYQAKDGLFGTEEYNGGCEDQDPLSPIQCATPFADQYANNPSGKFMFSNGDCTQWLITTYDQFSIIRPSPYAATILSSSYKDEVYTADWYKRCDTCGDPWVGVRDHCKEYGCLDVLYAEDSTDLHQTRFSLEDTRNTSLNVWVKWEQFELETSVNAIMNVQNANPIAFRNAVSNTTGALVAMAVIAFGMAVMTAYLYNICINRKAVATTPSTMGLLEI